MKQPNKTNIAENKIKYRFNAGLTGLFVVAYLMASFIKAVHFNLDTFVEISSFILLLEIVEFMVVRGFT